MEISAVAPHGFIEQSHRQLPIGECGLAGQRFERCVCPAPRRVEVAAIKRDQRARRFEDRVRLIRQPLTAGVRKSRCEPANRFELADQYSGSRRRGLTDLIERELGEAL